MSVLRALPSSPLQGCLGARQALGDKARVAGPLVAWQWAPSVLPLPSSPSSVSFSAPGARGRCLALPQAWEE